MSKLSYDDLVELGEDVLRHMDEDQEYIAHYGRLGMKWYQHIYGEYQGAAKYAEKGEKKLAKMRVKNERLSAKTAKMRALSAKANAKKLKNDYRAEKSGKELPWYEQQAAKSAKFQTALADMEYRDAKRALKTKKLEEKVSEVKAEADLQKRKEETNTMENATKKLEENGWKYSDANYAFSSEDAAYFTKKFKSNNHSFTFSSVFSTKEDDIDSFNTNAQMIVDKISENYDKLRTQMANKVYKQYEALQKSKPERYKPMSKKEFSSNVTLNEIESRGDFVYTIGGTEKATNHSLYTDLYLYYGDIDVNGKVYWEG